MRNTADNDRMIAAAQEELDRLDSRRKAILERIDKLNRESAILGEESSESLDDIGKTTINSQSSEDAKIALFRTLFRGREDVYARRYENVRTGKTGYFPASRTKWGKRLSEKSNTGSDGLNQRDFLPLTDEVIRNHLLGMDPQTRSKREFTIGVYPLLLDETCWFIAVDFDKGTWLEDGSAFLETCQAHHVPTSLERSRSGNGGHVWIFFSEPIASRLGRQLGSVILTSQWLSGMHVLQLLIVRPLIGKPARSITGGCKILNFAAKN